MIQCDPLSLNETGDLLSILHTTAKDRRSTRHSKRRISNRGSKSRRKMSHQESVDGDIFNAGQDLRKRVLDDGTVIRTCYYMKEQYHLAFRGEDLLHWMVRDGWADCGAEALNIAQLLLVHDVYLNVSDKKDLIVFKKIAIYRFREEEQSLAVTVNGPTDFGEKVDQLYRKLWADWVIRSRVIGWWLYTNTVKGSELVDWLTNSGHAASRDEGEHFATQLTLSNLLIRVYPIEEPVPAPSSPNSVEMNSFFTEASSQSALPEQRSRSNSRVFCDDDTIYQLNVCCNHQIDSTTKVMHRLAHAVRLCSVDTHNCQFYGKSSLEADVNLEQFEIDGEGEVKDRGDLMDSVIAECNEDSLISLDDDEDSSDSMDANDPKRFLQSVCRAFYPEFTVPSLNNYSYLEDGEVDPLTISLHDEMFHSYEISTFSGNDTCIIEYQHGIDLADMSISRTRESDLFETALG